MCNRRALRCAFGWTVLCLIVALQACHPGPHREITSVRPYAEIIGKEYTVIADDLYAYGIYGSLNDRTVDWVTLIAGTGINGPEVAFRQHIPKGVVIKILSAWEHPILFENGVYYRVSLHGSDISHDIPVRVDLSRGNRGSGADLNPTVYGKRR